MSRNRCTIECDCGYVLGLKNSFTRALHFKEYLQMTGVKDVYKYPYYSEYSNLIGCGVMCPECDTKYYFWIGGTQYIKGDRIYQQMFGDTSYWETFNDEPLYEAPK